MPWYRFDIPDLPDPKALDMEERFLDLLVNLNSEGLTDRRFGLFRSKVRDKKHQVYYVYADPKPFRKFLDDYGAIECEAPSEAQHIAGTNLLD